METDVGDASGTLVVKKDIVELEEISLLNVKDGVFDDVDDDNVDSTTVGATEGKAVVLVITKEDDRSLDEIWVRVKES